MKAKKVIAGSVLFVCAAMFALAAAGLFSMVLS